MIASQSVSAILAHTRMWVPAAQALEGVGGFRFIFVLKAAQTLQMRGHVRKRKSCFFNSRHFFFQFFGEKLSSQ